MVKKNVENKKSIPMQFAIQNNRPIIKLQGFDQFQE